MSQVFVLGYHVVVIEYCYVTGAPALALNRCLSSRTTRHVDPAVWLGWVRQRRVSRNFRIEQGRAGLSKTRRK